MIKTNYYELYFIKYVHKAYNQINKHRTSAKITIFNCKWSKPSYYNKHMQTNYLINTQNYINIILYLTWTLQIKTIKYIWLEPNYYLLNILNTF